MKARVRCSPCAELGGGVTREDVTVLGITKRGVRALVEAGDETAILALFDEDPHRVQRFLKRLACAPDAAHHARTIECFRMLSRERSARMPEFFRETIRRSLWEMNEESGNVAWSAPEIVAAVVAGAPERYGRFASYLIMAALGEPTFHPSLIAAADLLASANPALVEEFLPQLESLRR